MPRYLDATICLGSFHFDQMYVLVVIKAMEEAFGRAPKRVPILHEL
jgi:hypothetical protein